MRRVKGNDQQDAKNELKRRKKKSYEKTDYFLPSVFLALDYRFLGGKRS